MASRRAERIAERYRTRSAAVRARVEARLGTLFGDEIEPAAIMPSFDRFIERATPVIAAGQASIATVTAAYLRSIAFGELDELLEIEADDELSGTTRAGASLAEGLGGIGPMILAQIGAGHTVEEALDFGRYLVGRFGDAEITGAADRERERAAELLGPLTGWEGIVDADACDPCLENAGLHELTWTIYRHGRCHCTAIPVFGAAG